MAKTITDSQRSQTAQLVEQTFVPKVTKLLEALNKFLKVKGIRAGLELTWYFDDISDETEQQGKKTK